MAREITNFDGVYRLRDAIVGSAVTDYIKLEVREKKIEWLKTHLDEKELKANRERFEKAMLSINKRRYELNSFFESGWYDELVEGNVDRSRVYEHIHNESEEIFQEWKKAEEKKLA